MVTIRTAKVGDAPAICRLNQNEMGYSYPFEDTERNLRLLLADPQHRIFVAETETGTVGYVHAEHYALLYSDPMVNIMGIAVDAAYRHRGIGRLLLSAVEDWAKEENVCGVRLVSGAQRTDAHAFYRKCGYDGGKPQLNFKKRLS